MSVSARTMLDWVMRDPRREEWGFRWLTAHGAAKAFKRWRGAFAALANVSHRRREMDEYRKTRLRRSRGIPQDGDGDPSGIMEEALEAPPARAIDRERLDAVLARLTDTQLQMVMLLARGFTYEQVAAELRMPVGSVKSALHAMRRKLNGTHESHRSNSNTRGGRHVKQ